MKYNKGQAVFFTAFTKQDPNKFYICHGTIQDSQYRKNGDVYRVEIQAIARHAIGSDILEINQALILGRVISKKDEDIYLELQPFMAPKSWYAIIESNDP